MQLQRIQNNSYNHNPSFGIKISEEFIKAADALYCDRKNVDQAAFNKIYRKAKYMEKNYGFDDYTIVLSQEVFQDFSRGKKGKNTLMSILYAVKDDNSKKVLLIMKDGLNKLMNRFTRINEYELKNTIEGKFKLKPWE